MVQVFDNVITDEENRVLLNYVAVDNEYSDRSHLGMHRKGYSPQTSPDLVKIVTNVLDRILEKSYKIELLLLMDHQVEIKPHTDGAGAPREYLAITLMLDAPPDNSGGTVFFNNYTINCFYSYGMNPENITNYTNVPFPEDLRNQYCSFLPAEAVHGLLLDQCVAWRPNRAMTFSLNQIHCASSGAKGKKFIVVYTHLA
jgi:hypothetical protein